MEDVIKKKDNFSLSFNNLQKIFVSQQGVDVGVQGLEG
jgi:hypothetical protein